MVAESTPHIDGYLARIRATPRALDAPMAAEPLLRGLGREEGWEDMPIPNIPLIRDDMPLALRGVRGNWLRPYYRFQEPYLHPPEETNLLDL